MGTNWARINTTINRHLSEGHGDKAADYARGIISSHIRDPGSEEALTRILCKLAQSKDLHFIDLLSDVTGSANDGSRLKQVAAGCLLSLSLAFNRVSSCQAAQAVSVAVRELMPDSPAGKAAIDRLIDLAEKEVEDDAIAAMFLRLAAGRAVPGSPLAERGRDLWLEKLDALGEGKRSWEIKLAIERAPGESDIYAAAVPLWRDSVQEKIKQGDIERAYAEIQAIMTDPAAKPPLEKEAAGLWITIIDKWKQSNLNRAIIKAGIISDEIYKAALKPEQCAFTKEVVAWKLLELSDEVKNRTISNQMTLRAADYDGDNMALHRRLIGDLRDVVINADKWDHRMAAEKKVRDHIRQLNRHESMEKFGRLHKLPPDFNI